MEVVFCFQNERNTIPFILLSAAEGMEKFIISENGIGPKRT